MAERSFATEVQQLRIGEGEVFRGEGILAITKALLENGVGYVGGYQGAPISHLMDVLADAQDILAELDVHFEASASEAAATAMLAASVHYPIRGAVTFKSTVGLNVASDALANLASGGVTGGTLIIIGEDYGEGSSIMQERSHPFAQKSQVWLLDPRPNLPKITEMVCKGFELSEASNTPVMLEVRIRACHVFGQFKAKNNKRPAMSVAQALDNPQRDTARVVLPPASYAHEQEKIHERLPNAKRFISEHQLNEVFGDHGEIGIVMQGGMYNGVVRALQRLGLAKTDGTSSIPLYVLNVTYPIVEEEFLSFCQGKSAIMLVEEGQPASIEEMLSSILYRAQSSIRLVGKEALPQAGELTGEVILDGVTQFLRGNAAQMLQDNDRAPNHPVPHPEIPDLSKTVPPRPPGFCIGCPERPIFSAMKLAMNELGEHHVAGDIGCHLFAALPPFHIGATTMGYGLGAASASAFNLPASKRSISIMGDGGFWHNGLTSSIGNAVFNNHDGVIVIVDNNYTAATGGQDILSSRAQNVSKSTNHTIREAVKGIGVKWVRQLNDTYKVGQMQAVMREALTTSVSGPKVIIASSECMLNRQRREKPLFNKAVHAGTRKIQPRFGVDEDICTGDHACMRLSGCPSLTLKHTNDPLRDDPVAQVDHTCVGCGHCGEVADAAALCPSFYRAEVIHNPTALDRMMRRLRKCVISWLQQRRANGRLMSQS